MIDHARSLRPAFLSRLRSKVDRHNNLFPLCVVDSRPDWTKGLLAAALLVGTLLVMETNRIADEHMADARRARAGEERERITRESLDLAPQIRLEGEGYRCRNFKVRTEWVAVVARECERLGGLLRMARATE